MYQKTIMLLGIVGVLLSLALGLYSVITWQIVTVLVAVCLGIPSLILTYEKVKSHENIDQGKAVREHEKEIVWSSTPSTEGNRGQEGKAESGVAKEDKLQDSEPLVDSAQITKLNVDDNLLDQIYEQAHREVINIYHDAQLSWFCIQVFPFGERNRVNIYLDFYAKWANKVCKFASNDCVRQVKHLSPDKRPFLGQGREVFTVLPWKEFPQWMQFIERAYAKIEPLTPAKGTLYQLMAYPTIDMRWRLSFEDGFSGTEHAFTWNGKGFDESSITQLY